MRQEKRQVLICLVLLLPRALKLEKLIYRLNQKLRLRKKTIDSTGIDSEINRLHKALEQVRAELTEIKDYIAAELGPQKAEIF